MSARIPSAGISPFASQRSPGPFLYFPPAIHKRGWSIDMRPSPSIVRRVIRSTTLAWCHARFRRSLGVQPVSSKAPIERSEAAHKERPEVSRVSSLPALFAHFFANVENRGGGGSPFSRRWMRNDLWQATMVDIYEFSSGMETVDSRGWRSTFLQDHSFDLNGIQKNEWSLP